MSQLLLAMLLGLIPPAFATWMCGRAPKPEWFVLPLAWLISAALFYPPLGGLL